MKLTKEYIDIICPEHDRTSCSDDNLSNSYGGWYGDYYMDTGEKVIYYPRCDRCYLLANLDSDVEDLEFKIDVSVNLEFKDK